MQTVKGRYEVLALGGVPLGGAAVASAEESHEDKQKGASAPADPRRYGRPADAEPVAAVVAGQPGPWPPRKAEQIESMAAQAAAQAAAQPTASPSMACRCLRVARPRRRPSSRR